MLLVYSEFENGKKFDSSAKFPKLPVKTDSFEPTFNPSYPFDPPRHGGDIGAPSVLSAHSCCV